MSDDPLGVLERELVDAARRRAFPRKRRPSMGMLAVAASVAVTVAVVAGAFALLGGRKSASVPASHAIPGRQQLVNILGVLRRPQTQADRSIIPEVYRHLYSADKHVDTSLVRFATVTPWGERVYLVPSLPFSGRALTRLGPAPPGGEGVVETLSAYDDGGFDLFGSAAEIAARGGLGARGSRQGPGASTTRWIGLVPDGVAFVRLQVLGGRPARPGENFTAAVSNNVWALQARMVYRGTFLIGAIAVRWYTRGGGLIKRVTF
jgi:hypothetical protein